MSNRLIRHKRVRKKVKGDSFVPRLSVYRSSKHLYVQLIDDERRVTLLGMGTVSLKDFEGTKTEKAKELGKLFANKIIEKFSNSISRIRFDRGGYKYHGRIKAFADSLRQNGIIF